MDEILPGVGTTFPKILEGDARLAQDTVVGFVAVEGGYGTDPNLVTPAAPWQRVLSQYQKRQIGALCEILLPGTEDRPGPLQLGCVEFFDDWVSAPYAPQQSDATIVQAGLVRLDKIGQQLFEIDFLQLHKREQKLVVDRLIANGQGDFAFFVRFRSLMLGAYFTTDFGMRLLGYRGNVPLKKPVQLSKETLALIDIALAKLGL